MPSKFIIEDPPRDEQTLEVSFDGIPFDQEEGDLGVLARYNKHMEVFTHEVVPSLSDPRPMVVPLPPPQKHLKKKRGVLGLLVALSMITTVCAVPPLQLFAFSRFDLECTWPTSRPPCSCHLNLLTGICLIWCAAANLFLMGTGLYTRAWSSGYPSRWWWVKLMALSSLLLVYATHTAGEHATTALILSGYLAAAVFSVPLTAPGGAVTIGIIIPVCVFTLTIFHVGAIAFINISSISITKLTLGVVIPLMAAASPLGLYLTGVSGPLKKPVAGDICYLLLEAAMVVVLEMQVFMVFVK